MSLDWTRQQQQRVTRRGRRAGDSGEQALRNEEEGLKMQTEQKQQEAAASKQELAEYTAECELRRATLKEEQTREDQDTEWEQRQQVRCNSPPPNPARV
jgi:hypothetical protein